MPALPSDWPRLSAALFCADPRAAIDWYVRAFGFEVRILVAGDDGTVLHSELVYGGAIVMVAGAGAPQPGKDWRACLATPTMTQGRVTQSLALYVDDVDAHCARARSAGGRIVSALQTVDYGPEHWSDRNYAVVDPEGHLWWFLQRLSTRGVPHGA